MAGAKRSEAQLLLCCARSRRDHEVSARIEALLQDEIDWGYVMQLAGRHKMVSLLSWHLSATFREALPSTVVQELDAGFRTNGLRNLRLTGELLRLLHAFQVHEIPALPYKGPTLATLAYGNLALREFLDLDFLVREADVLRAKEVLLSNGYQPLYRMTSAREAAFIRYRDQYVYARNDTGGVVELHWELAPRAFSFPLNTEHLWKRLERISLGGDDVLVLSAEDLLLTLCVHGTLHRWERLAWVCDVAELIRARKDIDWDLVMERATSLGGRRALSLGLALAESMLDADLPEKVSHTVRAESLSQALATTVEDRLFEEETDSREYLEGASFRPFHLKAMESMRGRLLYCMRQATYPSVEDLEFVPLPARLFPVYRLLRPARLIGKFARKLGTKRT